MRIPSKFILYTAARFIHCLKISLKYGIATHRLDYETSKKRKRWYARANTPKIIPHQIREIAYTFTNDESDPQHLLKFTSRMINLSRMNLDFDAASFTNVTIFIRFLRKILTQHQKITKFSIILLENLQKSPRLWSQLNLLKFIEHTKFTNLIADGPSSLAPFVKFLKLNKTKHYWPKIQSQYLFLSAFRTCRSSTQIKEALENLKDNLFDLDPWITDSINKIKLTLNFKRYNRKPDFDVIFGIADFLGNVSNLACLKISGEVGSNFYCILDHFPQLKTLQVLSFIFLKQSPKTLSVLPQFASQIKTLTALGVNLQNKDGLRFLDQFTGSLCLLPQIQDLIITLDQAFMLSDATLSPLAVAISSLNDLDTLKVYRTGASNMINFECVDTGIQSLFEALASLHKLQGLSIIFEGLIGHLGVETMRTLCDSLKSLKRLKQLKLVFSESNIDSQGFWLLGKTLRDLKNIEELAISNYKQENEEESVLVDFLRDLREMRYLRHLQLDLKCERVDESLCGGFLKTLYELKSLDFFLVQIERKVPNTEAENLLKIKLSELNHTHLQIKRCFKIYR